MELTPIQEHLIEGLKLFGVHRDQAVAMMVFLKDNEEGMNELLDYMEQNSPSAHEIIKKSVEIVTKSLPKEQQEDN